jgi:hypothetical protein
MNKTRRPSRPDRLCNNPIAYETCCRVQYRISSPICLRLCCCLLIFVSFCRSFHVFSSCVFEIGLSCCRRERHPCPGYFPCGQKKAKPSAALTTDGPFPLTTADEPAEQPNQGAADDCTHSSSTQLAAHFVHSTI